MIQSHIDAIIKQYACEVGFTTPKKELSPLVRQYCANLSLLLDKHAPLKERLLPHSPWYTTEISEAKKLRHHYEGMWSPSGLTVHRDMFPKLFLTRSRMPHGNISQQRLQKTQSRSLLWLLSCYIARRNCLSLSIITQENWLNLVVHSSTPRSPRFGRIWTCSHQVHYLVWMLSLSLTVP